MQLQNERQQSFERRQEFLTEQANLKENLSDHQAARAIRQLRNAERRIRVYRYFKACRSKGTSPKQIHAIKVPTNWPTSKSPNLTSTQLSDQKLAKD